MSNITPAMPWYSPLSAHSAVAIGDADVGRLIRRRRIGILCFWLLILLSVNNLNALAVMALGTNRLFSYPMLISCIVVILTFQVAILRDMGTSGLAYILFLVTYLGISLPIGITNFSIEFPARLLGVQLYLTSLLVMAACALGARHTTLAWTKQRVLFWLYMLTLIQVVMVFVGMFFPKYLYAASGLLAEGRFSGLYRNPNQAGMANCACVAVGFAYLTVAKHKAWVIVGLLAASMATVLTFSRSSFLTLFLLITMQVLISPVIKRKSLLVVTMLAMIFLSWFAMVGVFSMIDVTATQSLRLESLKRILTFQVDVESDTGHRLGAAGAAIGHWLDSPVVGNGFNTLARMEETGLGPHNQYLKVLGEGGILALGTMLLFLAVFMYTAWKCKDRAVRALGLGVGFVFCCASMVDHTVLTNRDLAALMGVSMGMFAAVEYRTKVLQRMSQAARMYYPPPATAQPVSQISSTPPDQSGAQN